MAGSEPIWTHYDELGEFSNFPGVTLRVITGENVLTAWIRLAPGAVVPTHHHQAEQLGVVLEGGMDLTIGEETRRLGPGATYVIPSNVDHAATATADGILLLESFAPPREDYAALGREATAAKRAAGAR
jgi:quercetin dioxygenase-like cupin family protein